MQTSDEEGLQRVAPKRGKVDGASAMNGGKGKESTKGGKTSTKTGAPSENGHEESAAATPSQPKTPKSSQDDESETAAPQSAEEDQLTITQRSRMHKRAAAKSAQLGIASSLGTFTPKIVKDSAPVKSASTSERKVSNT